MPFDAEQIDVSFHRLQVQVKAKKDLSERSMQILKIFLKGTFSSGWEVELLYFLRKNENESWTLAQLVKHFEVEHDRMLKSLKGLSSKGLIVENEDLQNYRYSAKTSEQSALVELLVKVFEKKKLRLIRMIYE